MEIEVFGRKVTTVIVYNPELEKGQVQGTRINIDITKLDLIDIQGKLLKRSKDKITKGKKSTVESEQKAVGKILKHKEFVSDISDYEVLEKMGMYYSCSLFRIRKYQNITETQHGKTELLTDREDISNYHIISAYRSAWHIESFLKQMKDTDFITCKTTLEKN